MIAWDAKVRRLSHLATILITLMRRSSSTRQMQPRRHRRRPQEAHRRTNRYGLAQDPAQEMVCTCPSAFVAHRAENE